MSFSDFFIKALINHLEKHPKIMEKGIERMERREEWEKKHPVGNIFLGLAKGTAKGVGGEFLGHVVGDIAADIITEVTGEVAERKIKENNQ